MSSLLVGIFFGTFILEDVALLSAMALADAEHVSWAAAFLATFLGISVGDLGLFFLGRTLRSDRWKFEFLKRLKQSSERLAIRAAPGALDAMIFASRLIPGTRLPTYVAAGFMGMSVTRFSVLTILSVALWVGGVFLGGLALIAVLKKYIQDNVSVGILSLVALLMAIRWCLKNFRGRWERKAFLYKWRRWTHFEFWPAWFFYIPIYGFYIFFSVKYRSFLIPFYANPEVLNGGLIGESKWDFLKHLKVGEPERLNSVLIPNGLSLQAVEEMLFNLGLSYPLVLKPDVGQRGYAVRILRGRKELEDYLLCASGAPIDLIAQQLSQFQKEAGIFYYRFPNDDRGRIFSVTDKLFPFVVGDGRRALGDLILADKRARIIASVYFARHREKLDNVVSAGDVVMLSECGNHCQGAIFKNGEKLISDRLQDRIEFLAQNIPHFYFGRFDVRYRDSESLRYGENFEIVEVNGAGSEATHIWDEKTTLVEAYRVLFKQWSILFEIGHQVKKQAGHRPNLVRPFEFLKESWRVNRRRDPLSVSS